MLKEKKKKYKNGGVSNEEGTRLSDIAKERLGKFLEERGDTPEKYGELSRVQRDLSDEFDTSLDQAKEKFKELDKPSKELRRARLEKAKSLRQTSPGTKKALGIDGRDKYFDLDKKLSLAKRPLIEATGEASESLGKKALKRAALLGLKGASKLAGPIGAISALADIPSVGEPATELDKLIEDPAFGPQDMDERTARIQLLRDKLRQGE